MYICVYAIPKNLLKIEVKYKKTLPKSSPNHSKSLKNAPRDLFWTSDAPKRTKFDLLNKICAKWSPNMQLKSSKNQNKKYRKNNMISEGCFL